MSVRIVRQRDVADVDLEIGCRIPHVRRTISLAELLAEDLAQTRPRARKCSILRSRDPVKKSVFSFT